MSKNTKLLRILGQFTPESAALTLGQLSRLAGLPLSTTHRLVAELEEWGALEREGPRGPYVVGLRLWETGVLAPRAYGVRAMALPFLEDLYEVTRENVQLAVLDGDEALLVEVISGRKAIPLVAGLGGRLPLHASGVGQMLLAHAPTSMVERVLAQELPAFTDRTINDPQQLRRVLAECRQTGLIVSREAMAPGSISVAAPVFAGRDLVAAMSIVVHVGATDERVLAAAVRTAARGASRALSAAPRTRRS